MARASANGSTVLCAADGRVSDAARVSLEARLATVAYWLPLAARQIDDDVGKGPPAPRGHATGDRRAEALSRLAAAPSAARWLTQAAQEDSPRRRGRPRPRRARRMDAERARRPSRRIAGDGRRRTGRRAAEDHADRRQVRARTIASAARWTACWQACDLAASGRRRRT